MQLCREDFGHDRMLTMATQIKSMVLTDDAFLCKFSLIRIMYYLLSNIAVFRQNSAITPEKGSFRTDTNYEGSIGKGLFHGANDDLTDLYIINTPYFNGEFFWKGDEENGHFVLRSSPGSTIKGKETIIINKSFDAYGNITFEIILNDG